MENASREFTAKDVKDRIRRQQEVYQWEFQFLAANQDAFATGESIGINRDSCMNFVADKASVGAMCNMLYSRAKDVRQGKRKK